VAIKGAKHNDEFGDLPPSMDFGDLSLPPGVAQTVGCGRCSFTYTSLDAKLSARALAHHALHEHPREPNRRERRLLRKAGWVR
jgi:hypothetical protein